jgi:hypothetical protein
MDRSESNRNPELTELELQLRRLQPKPAGIDRDQLLFDSGRAAGARRPRTGLFAGILATAVIGLATAWWAEHTEREGLERELAQYTKPSASSSDHSAKPSPAPLQLVHIDRNSYLALRQLMEEASPVDQSEPADPSRPGPPSPPASNSGRPLGPRSSREAIDF